MGFGGEHRQQVVAAEVGLAGIALEAGKSLIVDKRAVRDEADRLGLFVTGITP